ncbi:tetratricopeptide repeat protein [Methylobacter sp.]|uniref:tetratricopeptide repeat protein n=1 Tax=Methylobacter sp. TaxID=2051955 RepID=UPI003DA6A972
MVDKDSSSLFHLYRQGLLSLGYCLFSGMTFAAKPPPEADVNRYLDKIRIERNENFIQREMREFSGFPHLDKAERLAAAGKTEEAVAEFERYLSIDPLDVKARMAYGMFLYKNRKFSQVIEQMDIILKSHPELIPAWSYRGLAKQALGDYQGANRDFDAVLANPDAQASDWRFALNSRIDISIQHKQYQQAHELLEKLAEVSPSFAAYYRKGVVLEELSRTADAVSAYQSAVKLARLDADRLRGLRALAEAYAKLNNWTEAKRTTERILQLAPDDLKAMRSLAYASYNLSDRNNAVKWIKNALTREDNSRDREFLANLLNENRQFDEACAEYARLSETFKEPDDRRRTLMSLGYCYQQLNRQKEAADAFQQAAAIGEDRRSLEALAALQEAKKDMAAALETYRRLLKISPTAQVHLKLANLYRASHDNQQALAHYENALKLGLDEPQKASVLAQMGMIHYEQGQYPEARSALERAAALTPNDPALLNTLGETALKTGEPEKALDYFQKAVAISPTARSLKTLANLNLKLGRWQAAENNYRQLLAGHKLAAREKAKIYESLSFVYTQLGQNEAAADYLDKAIAAGRDYEDAHVNLGYILFRQQRWQEALEQFSEALEHNRDPATLLIMGQIYRKLDRPKEAIAHLEEARLFQQQLDKAEKKALLDELGYLYADRNNYDQAVKVWRESLSVSPDPLISVSYAHGLRLLNRNAEAKAVLQGIDEKSLPDDAVKAQRWDDLALLYEADQAVNDAIEAQKRALDLEKTPGRHYQLGLFYQKANQPDAALAELRQAADLEPSNPAFKETLAYAYANADKPAEASRLLEQVAAKEPKRVDLLKNLGYFNSRIPDNEKAAHWFRQAIDTAEQYPDPDKTPAEQNIENYRLRREVEKLTHYFDISAYQSLRIPDSKGDFRNTTQGGILGGVIPSQGGVELAFQPPVIGLRNERIFQVFTRFLWNAPPGGLNVDSDSVQGGVGLRYKPFRKLDFYVSAEHLFKVGGDAINDWLLRASYGWNDGDEMKPGQLSWNYSTVYADLGYFINDPGIVAFYGEMRQGYSFNFYDTFLVTPHLVLDGRTQDHDESNISYLEGGGGFSFRYFFNESRYTSARSSIELLAQYKAGLSNIDGGFILTGVLRY